MGRGRAPRRGERQIASYMDGKGHFNKSNLGNWEQGKHCYRLDENTKSKTNGTEQETKFPSRRNVTDSAVESFWELTKWNKIPSIP